MKEKKAAEDTPLIKQYFEVKSKNPEAVLLYRVGDFYETYSDDAVLASKVLGIVLTRKSNGAKGEIAMAGFPHHAIDAYLPKLVQAGYKVAVCDQLENPKFAGKLVKRGVTELVTPGVAFGAEMLDSREHNYLAGIYSEKDQYGAAFLDVSTGTFQIAQGSLEFIRTLLSNMAPKELLVRKDYAKLAEEKLGTKAYVSTAEEWAFVYDSCTERLCRQLQVDSLKGYGVDSCPLGICAAGALLVYLDQTHHGGLKNICSISRIDEGRFVWMDRFTVRNLEIFHSSAGGEGVPLVSVMDRCSSPMGSRLLKTWLALPVMDVKELGARYDVISYFMSDTSVSDKVRQRISCIGDMERIISRAAAGKITPREILQLGRGLGQLPAIAELCREGGDPAAASLADRLLDCGDLVSRIRKTIREDCAAIIGKGPVIAKGVDAELDSLREISNGGKDYLLQLQQSESERTGIPSLKISYNNVFGYYLEVRNSYKDRVPPEWIRKQTLVNAERYITQELKDYEAKILGAEEKIYEIETGIFSALAEEIRRHIPDIQKNAGTIARIDVLAGFAALAQSNNYCRPEMNDGLEIDIKTGRHPVIETLMAPGEEYVPNDIHLDSDNDQIMILTGPNMAGKSALLRQTALIVLMAQTGSFVPASSARIGICDKIFTRVGASDNISRGESTFMVEMLETAMILNNLSERSLVLLDEIGRGTSTYDGMSIARAIVEYIHEYGKRAKTLFATHYHELNDLENIYPRVSDWHIEVKEVGKKVIFLRKLAKGGSAHSFGIHVARLAGMPREVISSAEKTLAALEKGESRGIGMSDKGNYGKIRKAYNTREGVVTEDGAIQLSLFQLEDPALSSLKNTLKSADLNNMTPLQAFDLLRSMKKELGI